MRWICGGREIELKRDAVERERRSALSDATTHASAATLSQREWEIGWSLEDKRAYGRGRGREAERLAKVLAAIDSGAEWMPAELYPVAS